MTKEEALIEMKKIVFNNDDDIETNHIEADKILCDFLIAIGHNEIVDEYNKISKWYA